MFISNTGGASSARGGRRRYPVEPGGGCPSFPSTGRQGLGANSVARVDTDHECRAGTDIRRRRWTADRAGPKSLGFDAPVTGRPGSVTRRVDYLVNPRLN